jgi:eukaryotic-like serine/threonine-protein kinase
MSLPDRASWARLSPILDELLDLDPRAGAERLEEWRRNDPALADELQALLTSHAAAATSGLLEGAAEADREEPTIVGTRIGAYRIEAALGEGGGGTVWRARRMDGRFEGEVAIKLLHFSRLEKASLARFRREGGILARLTHPNIARLFDAGVAAGGQPYLILELVEGEPIDEYANARGLTIRERIALFRQATLAVAHAHRHLTVHRDLKPSNILVDHVGVVKLLDFGIAKLLDADAASESELTLDGRRFLTPAYAAPEQLAGGEVTTATDVYALGIVLFRLLAEVHPTMPEGATAAQAIRSTIETEPATLHTAAPADDARTLERAAARGTSPQRLVHQLRGDLSNIVARCLRKSPNERYATAAEFSEDLRRYLRNEPVEAGPDSLLYRTGKFIRKYRVAVAASVLTTVFLIVATVVSTWQMLEAQRQREEAAAAAVRAESWSRLLTMMVHEIGTGDSAMSPTQMIDRGVYLLDQQNDETRPMVDQLIQLSYYYFGLNEMPKASALLVRAEALARKLHYDEGLAKTLCETIGAQLALDQRDRAKGELDEARRIIATLRRPVPALEANCDDSAGDIEDANGHSRAAIAIAEHGLSLLSTTNHADDALYAAMATRLSKYYDDLGDSREAHRYTDVALAAYNRAGAGGTIERLIVLTNEASDFVNFGQLRDALDVMENVMQRLKARGDSDEAGLGPTVNYAGILSGLGRQAEALAVLDRTIPTAQASKNEFWLQRGRFFKARALLRAGRFQESRGELDAVELAYRQDQAANKSHLQSVTLVRAEWLLRTGDPAAADAMIKDLLRDLGYPTEKTSWVLGALPLAAEIALVRQDAEQARTYANAAVKLARDTALDPTRSADLGRAMVLLGRAQFAAGMASEGLETIRQAVPSLVGGLGADHGEVSAANLLLATNSLPAQSAVH